MSEIDIIIPIGPFSIKIKMSLIEIMRYYITYISHIFVFIFDFNKAKYGPIHGL